MSVLAIYEDDTGISVADQLSQDGAFTNPDEETSLAGTAGQTKAAVLHVAPDQTTLAVAITSTTATSITLTSARFSDTDYSVIMVDSEKMLITAGHGTTTLTVTREYNGTTAATHLILAEVYAAYDFTAITIDCVDNTGTDESAMMTFRDNGTGSYEAPHSIDDIDYDESVAIQRQLVVAASTAAQYKRDLILRLSATVNETT